MKSLLNTVLIILLIGLSVRCSPSLPQEDRESMEVNFITNIDDVPRFSWAGSSQAYYQISLHQSGKEIWKGEKQATSEHTDIKYSGDLLSAGEEYHVTVSTWDAQENALEEYASTFFPPLSYPGDWNKARWISFDYHADSALPVFRKEIALNKSKEVENARLYISAPGFYEAFLNGEKIGENVLDPAQTNFEDYTFYTAYDLDPEELQNSLLEVMLGNGWYNQNVVWNKSMIYGQPVFIAQIIINYGDGTREVIGTDESWQWQTGPITFSNIYAGEFYDARRELDETREDRWKAASPAKLHPKQLKEQYLPPIREMEEVKTVKITEPEPGVYVFDLGQNITGWPSIQVKGTAGQEITMRFAEEIDNSGNIDPTSTGVKATKHVQTCKYICKGDEMEYWQPQFTYHGFRYIEVSGLKEKPGLDFLTGKVLYSSMEQAGTFTSSEPTINKLHDLTVWTIKGNMQGIPTDCPHREKCGWTGDAHAVIHALIYNMDSRLFLTKYMFDMRSSGRNTTNELYFGESFHDRSVIKKPAGIPTMIVPGRRTSGIASPDWGTAQVQVPWYLYLYYGQEEILETFYPDMKVWTDYIQAKNVDGIITHGLGDWCPPSGNQTIECPVPISSSAFHILDVKLMIEAAKVLGRSQDQGRYEEQLKQLISSFNREFLNPQDSTYGSQTADVLALEIGIVPDEFKKGVARSIVKDIHGNGDGFLTTGIFGISRLFKVLSENGQEAEVYRLLTKTGVNSFDYMWEKYDATTLWEVLPVKDLAELYNGRSHSHPMQGGFDAWFYSGLGGINPSVETPGFEKIIFKPYLSQYIQNTKASHRSRHGQITSEWHNEQGEFTWNITIPENTTADIYVPIHAKDQKITLNREAVIAREESDEKFSFIGSYEAGSYTINVSTTSK